MMVGITARTRCGQAGGKGGEYPQHSRPPDTRRGTVGKTVELSPPPSPPENLVDSRRSWLIPTIRSTYDDDCLLQYPYQQ